MAEANPAEPVDPDGFRETVYTVTVPMTRTIREHMLTRAGNGDFAGEGDYIRNLIAYDLERARDLEAALQVGLDSGYSDRSIDDIIADAKRRYREAQTK